MVLYSISLRQLFRSTFVLPLVALGAVCFSIYNPLHTSYRENELFENIFVGTICTSVEVLAVWALARYWYFWYRLITRAGSVWRASFTRAFFALVGVFVLLIGAGIIFDRIDQVLPALDRSLTDSQRVIVLISASAWIVGETLIEVSLVISTVAILALGPAALWGNRKAIRLWWVNKRRGRGTCRYPRVPS